MMHPGVTMICHPLTATLCQTPVAGHARLFGEMFQVSIYVATYNSYGVYLKFLTTHER